MSDIEPNEIKSPRIKFEEIRKQADEFRLRNWKQGVLPVDILRIAEFNLDLDFIPVDKLKSTFDIDALLFNGLKSIAVDKAEFMNDIFENRLRFSVAHEIGHIVLHSSIYEKLSFDSLDEKIKFISLIDEEEYNWIEQQAYEFAGRLLVPLAELEQSLKEISKGIKKFKEKFGNDNIEMISTYVSSHICKKFGASDIVIQKRIKVEKFEAYLE